MLWKAVSNGFHELWDLIAIVPFESISWDCCGCEMDKWLGLVIFFQLIRSRTGPWVIHY